MNSIVGKLDREVHVDKRVRVVDGGWYRGKIEVAGSNKLVQYPTK